MTDTPREQEPDDTEAARASRFGMGEPTASVEEATGPGATEAIEHVWSPADWRGAEPGKPTIGRGSALPDAPPTSPGISEPAEPAAGARDTEAIEPTTGPPAGAEAAGGSGAAGSSRRVTFAEEPDPESEAGRRQRRRRRLFVTGIAVAAALIILALCAGVLGVISAVSGFRDQAADARENRRLRETSCLELEQRLNRLTPPGATANAPARATAIRDENSAVRIYVEQSRSEREQNAWRELLDARTAYAEALMQQAKTRTPAFFVAPRAEDGSAVTDQLERWSPAACAGAIRRLAAPDW